MTETLLLPVDIPGEAVLYRFDNGWTCARVLTREAAERLERDIGPITELHPNSLGGISDVILLVFRGTLHDVDRQVIAFVILKRARGVEEDREAWYLSDARVRLTEDNDLVFRAAILTVIYDWLELSPKHSTMGVRRLLSTGFIVSALPLSSDDAPPIVDVRGCIERAFLDPDVFDVSDIQRPMITYMRKILSDLVDGPIRNDRNYHSYSRDGTANLGLSSRWIPDRTTFNRTFDLTLELTVHIDWTEPWDAPWFSLSTPGKDYPERARSLVEALRLNGLLRTVDEWNQLLDANFLAGEPTIDLEPYRLLLQLPPVLWPLKDFRAWLGIAR